MSTYYGQVKGQAETVASRLGNEESGIRVSAQSWDGSVIIEMHKGEIIIEISDESSFYGHTYFHGSLNALKECLS